MQVTYNQIVKVMQVVMHVIKVNTTEPFRLHQILSKYTAPVT